MLVQNPFHIRGPILAEACSVRVVRLCPSPHCHRVRSGHWASPSEPLSSVGRLWGWSFVLIRRHSVNSQGRPLPHRSLTGLLAGGVTVQWSRTATSCLGGRDREAHPDFKDDRTCITALLRSRRFSSSAAFFVMMWWLRRIRMATNEITKESALERKPTVQPSLNGSPNTFLNMSIRSGGGSVQLVRLKDFAIFTKPGHWLSDCHKFTPATGTVSQVWRGQAFLQLWLGWGE